jgi:predicted nuclease with TOPRIM domain
MNVAEITAVGASLASLAGVLKVLFDSRRRDKRLGEQLEERRDERMFERLRDELARIDAKLDACEQKHEIDQRRITELEQGRVRREAQLAEMTARISQVAGKVDVLQTGMFETFDPRRRPEP